jgi:hypothetical protein
MRMAGPRIRGESGFAGAMQLTSNIVRRGNVLFRALLYGALTEDAIEIIGNIYEKPSCARPNHEGDSQIDRHEERPATRPPVVRKGNGYPGVSVAWGVLGAME